jgi:hypothetical protein
MSCLVVGFTTTFIFLFFHVEYYMINYLDGSVFIDA